MTMKWMYGLVIAVSLYTSCYGMTDGLTGVLLSHDGNVQEQVTVVAPAQAVASKAPSFFSRYIARYMLHALYLSALLTAIVGGYFLISDVVREISSMKESCSSMKGTCDDCTDAVAMIKPYILLIANFTQGCPTAMDELKTATYFSMLNCREEGKCKPLPMFKKP